MPDEKTVFNASYESINQEIDRILYLLKPTKDNPLGEIVERIHSKFRETQSQVQNARRELRQAKDGQKSLEDGWKSYTRLKTELLPILSSELLAVLGGVYLTKAKLDHMGDFDGKSGSGSSDMPLSFSKMAETLVDDLARRGGGGWAPVLIVGEERLGHSVAEIIRLRFPACDIWHLPFAAHEYGYLVAQLQAPGMLENFRAHVRINVDPRQHKNNAPPEDESCYLEEVRRLWKIYYNAETGQERDNFSKNHEQELITLGRRQEALLCRLFADAFATSFVGPAYVYALLHLSFIPDATLYQPSATMPAFAHRFFIAMETLKWMNEELSQNPNDNLLFADEVDPTTGIPDLWRKTVNATRSDDRYREIAKACDVWLTQIKEILIASFIASLDETRDNWLKAKDLKERLKNVELKVEVKDEDDWPSTWEVLNAAWSARWDNPAEWKLIQSNALRVLKKDRSAIEGASNMKGNAPEKPKVLSDEQIQRVKVVRSALASEPDCRKKFVAMSESGAFKKDDDILKFLDVNNSEAYDAYVELYIKSTQ